MAAAKDPNADSSGLLTKQASPYQLSNYNANPTPTQNPGGQYQDAGLASGYAYGLPTNLTANNTGTVYGNGGPMLHGNGAGYNFKDADVHELQRLQNELANGISGSDVGVNQVADQAQINALKARIGLKNTLGSAINSNDTDLGNALDNERTGANRALQQGVTNTRKNYNSAGLLYSGMREGGENAVRGAVGSNLAANIAGTKRDYENTNEARKAAYAQVDFGTQQQALNLANQAFDITTKNNIARNQAMEQLGYGAGSLVGTVAGQRNAQRDSTYNLSYGQQPSNTGQISGYNYNQSPQQFFGAGS